MLGGRSVRGGRALLLHSLRRLRKERIAPFVAGDALVNSSKSDLVRDYTFFGSRSMALATIGTSETKIPSQVTDGSKKKNPTVVFVLGGPGSGKGTQCSKIVENFGFVHLSAGDLLRAEINSGSENGTMISNMIKEGKIVPSEVTVRLLEKAMNASGNHKFLIDGFPRNEENRSAFETVTGISPEFILFFDCPQEEMEVRLLGRNEGRVDDNIETIRKRFKVFIESSLPVIGYYESKGKVRKVDAARSKDAVFESIQPLFTPFVENENLHQHSNA